MSSTPPRYTNKPSTYTHDVSVCLRCGSHTELLTAIGCRQIQELAFSPSDTVWMCAVLQVAGREVELHHAVQGQWRAFVARRRAVANPTAVQVTHSPTLDLSSCSIRRTLPVSITALVVCSIPLVQQYVERIDVEIFWIAIGEFSSHAVKAFVHLVRPQVTAGNARYVRRFRQVRILDREAIAGSRLQITEDQVLV